MVTRTAAGNESQVFKSFRKPMKARRAARR
jgi:hypothetical protein